MISDKLFKFTFIFFIFAIQCGSGQLSGFYRLLDFFIQTDVSKRTYLRMDSNLDWWFWWWDGEITDSKVNW